MGCLKLKYLDNSGTLEKSPLYFFDVLSEKTETTKNRINYSPFGSVLPGRSFNATEDTYRYAFNGMEADGQIKGERNSYTTEFRQYDPRVGRWLSRDLLSESQPGWSPYKAFYNNPLTFTDTYGLTEEERRKALAHARKFIASNPNPSSSMYGFAGYHAGEPGKAIDCSGLVSQSAKASGFGYLNSIPSTGPHAGETDLNGVGNIINQPMSRKVSVRNIKPGNIVTMSTRVTVDGIPVGHVGFVDNIKRDSKGNVVSFTLVHSGSSTGPTETLVELNNPNNYWVKNFGDQFNYWAWDTPEDGESKNASVSSGSNGGVKSTIKVSAAPQQARSGRSKIAQARDEIDLEIEAKMKVVKTLQQYKDENLDNADESISNDINLLQQQIQSLETKKASLKD